MLHPASDDGPNTGAPLSNRVVVDNREDDVTLSPVVVVMHDDGGIEVVGPFIDNEDRADWWAEHKRYHTTAKRIFLAQAKAGWSA